MTVNPHQQDAAAILDGQVIRIKRGRMNKFGFEPAWNAYYDFYLSDKYLEGPILKLEDIAFHLFLRKNLNNDDPTWHMPSFRMMKQRLGVSQDKLEGMIERLTKARLLEKVSGQQRGGNGANVNNTYVLSDPIQSLDEYLLVGAAGEFPEPVRQRWLHVLEDPVPEIGTGGYTENRYRDVPENGTGGYTDERYTPVPTSSTHKQTSIQQTSTTGVGVDEETKSEDDIESDSKKNAGTKSTKSPAAQALVELGISPRVAKRLASRYGEQKVFEKIEYLTFLEDNDPEHVNNPRGWLRTAIEEDFGAPDGYKNLEELEREAVERKEQSKEREELEVQRPPITWQQRMADSYSVSDDLLTLTRQLQDALKLQLTAATFDSWVANLMIIRLSETEIHIVVPSQAACAWIVNRLRKKFEVTLAQLVGYTAMLHVEVTI